MLRSLRPDWTIFTILGQFSDGFREVILAKKGNPCLDIMIFGFWP